MIADETMKEICDSRWHEFGFTKRIQLPFKGMADGDRISEKINESEFMS
jgi:hypothetical protein